MPPKDFVLLRLAGDDPPLVLGAPDGTRDEIQQMGSALLSELRKEMGSEWNDDWVADLPVIPRDQLAETYRRWRAHLEEAPTGPVDETAMADAERVAATLPPDTDPAGYQATHAMLGDLWFRATGDERDRNVEKAIRHLAAAISVPRTDSDDELRAVLLLKLSYAYILRPLGDRADNLEHAIRYAREVADNSRVDAVTRARAAGNAASALLERGAGDPVGTIEEAIELLLPALATFRAAGNRADRATTGVLLARAYATRLSGDRAANGDEALGYADLAVEDFVALGRIREAAGALVTLGNVWDVESSDEARDKAAAAYHRGLELPGLPSFEEAQLHTCLATLYRGHRHSARPPDLDLALDHYEAAAAAVDRARYPLEWAAIQQNTAWAYAFRRRPGDAERAAAMMADAARTFRAGRADAMYARAMTELGSLLFEAARWADAAAAYEQAIAAGEAELREADTPQGRRVTVARLGAAFPEWAYALVQLDRPQDAVRALEAGKQRLTRQPGVTRDWPVAEIAGLAPAGGAIVLLVCTAGGAAAVIVTPDTKRLGADETVRLPDFTLPRLHGLLVNQRTLLPGDDDPLHAVLRAGPATIDVSTYARDFRQFGHLLWERVMEAVTERLDRLGVAAGAPVVLVPHGGLGLLPWHTAGPPGGPQFADRHPVVHAPSLEVLRFGREAAAGAAYADRLVALADPAGDLPYARAEVMLSATRFPSARPYAGPEATRQALIEGLADATHVHLACHGYYDWTDLMQSALQLGGGELRLEETTTALRPAHVRFAFLSACETGISSVDGLANEYLGFSAALHRAGIPVVVSSLWPMEDSVVALVAIEFYRRHRDGGQSPAEALRGAELWLRDATRETLLDWLTAAAGTARSLPDDRATWLTLQRLRERIRDTVEPGDTPYASPQWWAPLVVSGYAYA